MPSLSSAKSGKKQRGKLDKLDQTLPNDVKEKVYVTKQVDSSITILDSLEDDVVLEALLYLSKYVDVHITSISYGNQRSLLLKLIKLLNRNICILKLSLRLLGVLLTSEDVMVEIDQDEHDDKVLKIVNMFVTHTDPYVQQFCVAILSKLAESGRITCLIFKTDLCNPILEIIQKGRDVDLLKKTLELFLKLLDAPAALGMLPEIYNFDMPILLMHLDHPDKGIAQCSLRIIQKLTYYCLDVFQRMFKDAKLVEKMLETVMTPEKHELHAVAFDIICNSIRSEETSSYYIESTEFLKFCEWVKTCEPEYLYPSIVIFEHLSKLTGKKQILFDLSVEDTILYFLRTNDKKVLYKTCEAISNMTSHKYCCDRMLTPVVLKELFDILTRNEGDPGNEVALKTILDFSRRHVNTLDMIQSYGLHRVLVSMFKKGHSSVSEKSFLAILEILYKMSMHPKSRQDIADTYFFDKLLTIFQTAPTSIATFACEIMTTFVTCVDFRRIFLSSNGPQIIVGALQTTTNKDVLRHVFIFINSSCIYPYIVRSFLQNNLVRVLMELPESLKQQMPIVNNIFKLVYSLHVPLKFFKTGRLEVIDKLGTRFYLIKGQWTTSFPFLEIIERSEASPIRIIYVVDYAFEMTKFTEEMSLASDWAVTDVPSTERNKTSKSSLETFRTPFQINYGSRSSDPFLPRYIYHISKYIDEALTMKEKITILAQYVDQLLSGPDEDPTVEEMTQTFDLHIETLKRKLGTSLIPIGYLRMGLHCEKALLFKAIADKCLIPTSLVKGSGSLYWNEVALFDDPENPGVLKFFVVDLMKDVGNFLQLETREANRYRNLLTWSDVPKVAD